MGTTTGPHHYSTAVLASDADIVKNSQWDETRDRSGISNNF